jgi:hypothetical protein
VPLAGMLLLAGCATGPPAEQYCTSGDFAAAGLAAGRDGRLPDAIVDLEEACAPLGVEVDESAWYAGYERGLEAYCEPKQGYLAGRRGERYHGVCDDPGGEFAAAWRRGLEEHRIEERAFRLRQRAGMIDARLRVIEGELRQAALEPTRRWALERERSELTFERERIRVELALVPQRLRSPIAD